MTRKIAVLLCLTVLCSVLWGCQKSASTQNPHGAGLLVSSKATQPTQITTPATEASALPTTVPTTTETASDEWKFAYIDLIQELQTDHLRYALVYIDSDAIPELYASGDCEATGDGIYTCKNGKITALRLNRIGGGRYVPGEGLLCNTNGNMGYYTTEVYRLEKGHFRLLWTGLETQEYAEDQNGILRFTVTYHIGDATVDQSNYYAAMGTFFPEERALPLNENVVTYEDILQQLLVS